ncbi:uncharacterized protein LOC120266536 isoform X1 [Dioscorea cayenensis subsp. rotundata]|uniref:Uncharacterized protein LOC120266536 isoform X1 n=1 Tax=Dioscorea cayennensis subsp. rotundata TaxID=55577 RepID=A0AB40BRK3_DIOCR|nr:uncharacterized protein LOC120266536 isoform X1 [Dioscorea cayenensis subsp. rotundata]
MEQEYCEFEMLLGEIPDATLVNLQQSDTSATNNSLKLGTVPKEQVEQKSLRYLKYINSHSSPQHSKNGNKRTLFDSLSSSKGYFDHTAPSDGNGTCDYSNLQDTYSLASAFGELSLKDGSMTKPDTLTSVMHDSASSCNQNFMSDKENALLNRFKLGMNCVGMPLSSSHVAQVGAMEMPTSSSLTMPNGCHLSDHEVEAYRTLTRIDGVGKFSAKMDIQDSSEFLMKKRPEDLPGGFQGPQQNLANYPGTMPLYSESHAFDLLSRVPSSKMELASPAIQQQYYMNAESTTPHKSSRFNMDWQNPEGYHDAHQQIFYPPYVQNQGLPFHQIPNGVVSCIRSSTGNNIQPYFRYPGHHKGYNDFEVLPMDDSPYQFCSQDLFRDENCCGVFSLSKANIL